MKKVVSSSELKNKMVDCVNMLCDAVSSTLGPTGNNVLISNSDSSSFITNDGVTIASNIESDDSCSNAILDIIKEAALKTNELVGDGTTTTLVLLQSIFNQGVDMINNGYNAITLKYELYDSLDNVLKILSSLKRKPTNSDLLSIASVSTNDLEMGKYIYDLYIKMKNRYAIKIMEGYSEDTYYNIKKGYIIDINGISSLFFNNKKSIELNYCDVFVVKGFISSMEQISEIINEGVINNKNIIIFAEDYERHIEEELLAYYLTENIRIIIISISEYGSHRDMIFNDLSILSGCAIKNIEYEKVYYSDCGVFSNILINNGDLIISFDKDRAVKLRNLITKELSCVNSEYDKEFIMKRLCMINKGIAYLYVGGITKTEIKEKIMRFEDGLCALASAESGVCLGEGVTLMNVSNLIGDVSCGDKIIKNALCIPFNKIIENIGLDPSKIKNEIVNHNYKKVYNYINNTYEESSSILDPFLVLSTCCKNAVSIASILLTTNYLVVCENISI